MTLGSTPSPDWIVLVAASAGGIGALQKVLKALPAGLPAAVIVAQHRTPSEDDGLPRVLARSSSLPVKLASEGDPIEPGVVYLARSDNHLTLRPDGRLAYVDGTKIRWLRSSANPLFESAARAFKGRVIAVVLTGSGHDGTDGVQTVKASGGFVIAQDEASAQRFEMPRSAIETGAVDRVLPLDEIAPAIVNRVTGATLLGALDRA